MPKEPSAPILNIDLLKSQTSSQKFIYKAINWLLSSGRYLIIFVELLVLVAFLTRFFFDAQIETIKDDIAKRSVYVQSLKPTENEVRKLQSQLNSIKKARADSFDFDNSIKKIADQTPPEISLSNITFDSTDAKISFRISGAARSNLDLSNFVYGLKTESSFTDVDIANIDLQENVLSFSVTGNIKK